MTDRVRPASSALALLLFVLALAAGPLAPTASAHDRLIDTQPGDNASVDTVERVSLTFNAAVLGQGARIEVTDPSGKDVSDGAVDVDGNKVTRPLTPGAAGTYKVTWRVTSSDGHPISGTFDFRLTTAAAAPTSSATGTAAATSTPADMGGAATSSSTSPTPEPSTRIGTDDTSNQPLLIAGLAVLAVVAIGVGVLISRRRLRDDE